MTLVETKCPDCEGNMAEWIEGDHPEYGMTPRAKCKQCGRWVYNSLRFTTNSMEELK
tara:strand:+ start:166 stop:336 length:171 start_codon:yes stop_codon:yes gene_type:complete